MVANSLEHFPLGPPRAVPTVCRTVVTAVATATTAAAVDGTDYIYLVSGTTTLTLPTAVGNTATYVVKNSGTNTVTVATTSSETVNATTPATLATLTFLRYVSDGANWWTV